MLEFGTALQEEIFEEERPSRKEKARKPQYKSKAPMKHSYKTEAKYSKKAKYVEDDFD